MKRARYEVTEQETVVSIDLSDVADERERLLTAFVECQAGRCSCPTDEYGKVASMDVEHGADTIHIRLEPKAGERFDLSEIAACLDYTTTSDHANEAIHRFITQRNQLAPWAVQLASCEQVCQSSVTAEQGPAPLGDQLFRVAVVRMEAPSVVLGEDAGGAHRHERRPTQASDAADHFDGVTAGIAVHSDGDGSHDGCLGDE